MCESTPKTIYCVETVHSDWSRGHGGEAGSACLLQSTLAMGPLGFSRPKHSPPRNVQLPTGSAFQFPLLRLVVVGSLVKSHDMHCQKSPHPDYDGITWQLRWARWSPEPGWHPVVPWQLLTQKNVAPSGELWMFMDVVHTVYICRFCKPCYNTIARGFWRSSQLIVVDHVLRGSWSPYCNQSILIIY